MGNIMHTKKGQQMTATHMRICWGIFKHLVNNNRFILPSRSYSKVSFIFNFSDNYKRLDEMLLVNS